MKKRNACIAFIIILSLICTLPSLITRIGYEASHKSFETAILLTSGMTETELETLRENDITLLVAQENNSSFDEEKIRVAKNLGFDIALKINIGEKCAEGFREKLDLLVKETSAQYILISSNESTDAFDAPLEKVIKSNAMTVVLCETQNQLSNEMPKGYERYIEASGGRLMRSYITLKNPASKFSDKAFSGFGDLLYHQMTNSVRDRNTEFLAISIIESDSLSRKEAIEETLYAVKKFKDTAKRLGYVEGKKVNLDGYSSDSRLPTASALMLSVIMALISIEILLKKRISSLEWVFCILAFPAFGIAYILPESLIRLIPTLFAPLSAIFAFSAAVKTAKEAKTKNLSFASSLFLVFTISLLALFVGSIFLSTMLSGAQYYLNNIVFRGVKLSLALPVLYALAFVWIYENKSLKLKVPKIKTVFSKIKLYHIIILAVAIAAAFVYIIRSGDTKVSLFENATRNLLANLSAQARPRTKEFVIGWPLLALSVYFTHYEASSFLKGTSFAVSSVLFASVTNTFCHVFADFATSSLRTFNGLLFSIPFVVIILLVASLFKNFLKNNKQ